MSLEETLRYDSDSLLKDPRTMGPVFMELFKGITSAQLLITLQKCLRYNYTVIKDYLFKLCNTSNTIAELTDNELRLTLRDAGKWVAEYLGDRAVYMSDTKTWYYLQHGAYLETPPTVDEDGDSILNPIEEAKDEYISYLMNWAYRYPLFSDAINKAIDNLDRHCEQFDYYIEKAQNYASTVVKIRHAVVA